jgi:alpha-N-arabinofuranosidase
MKARQLWLLGAFAPYVAFAQTANVTVDIAAPGRAVDERLFGANSTAWDSALGTPQTLSLLQAAGLRAIRLPGGSLSDEYHWRTNTNLDHATIAQPWSWAAGFDKSSALTLGLNAHAMVTVNYGTGTPEEAAAWVAYANFATSGGSDVTLGTDAPASGTTALPTPVAYDWQTARTWANLRAASPLATDDGMNFLRLGRAQPLAFKYWEVGNENYGDWESDLQSPAHSALTYANRAAQYMTKMRSVDSSIKIGVVVAKSGEYANWTQVALGQLNTLGVRPDFVIYHRYDGAPGQESDATLLQSANTWAADEANLRTLVNAAFGASGPGIEIVVTENNSVYSNPGKQSTNLVNGLFLADSLGNVLAKTHIAGFFWWDVRNGPSNANNNAAALYGWRGYGDYGLLSSVPGTTFTGAPTTSTETYPTYHAFKLLSYFARGGDTVLPATADSNLVSAFAVQRAGGGQSLLVINKNATSAVNVSLTLAGATATSATIYTYGKDNDAAAQTGTSGCSEITSSTATVTAGALAHSFPSYSMSVVWLGPNAPATPATTPVVVTQPTAVSRTAGTSATFTAAASGCPLPSYHWQRAPSGSSTYTDVAEGGAYSGTATGTLTVSATTTAMSGDQFRLSATNGTGTANSGAVALTVTAAATPPANPPSGGGGGGGGRVDLVLLALLALCLALHRSSGAGARRDSVIRHVRNQPHPVARTEARFVHRPRGLAGG